MKPSPKERDVDVDVDGTLIPFMSMYSRFNTYFQDGVIIIEA